MPFRFLMLTSLLLPGITVAAECVRQSLPAQLEIRAGLQQTISLPAPMSRIAIGEPSVADIAVVNPRTLLVQGKASGETSLFVWTACAAEPARASVRVAPELQATRQLASAASAAQTESQARATLASLPSQVQADIRFVEVSRSRLIDVGTRLQLRSANRPNVFASPNSGRVTASPGSSSLTDLGSITDSFNIFWGGSSDRFMAAINLLEQSGHAYTLSRPSLVAMNGQSANFLAGGEVPIPVPQGQNGSVAIEYKQFGVRLTISPTIMDAEQILLKVAPEVSELDFNNAVSIQGTQVPALRIRRTDTTISLADGESFIIGGLVSRSTLSNVDKLPGFGDLPILGAFFRSTRFEAEDRELLMIVTPRLVRPIRRDARLPALPGTPWQNYEPSAGSLFWKGVTSPYSSSTLPSARP